MYLFATDTTGTCYEVDLLDLIDNTPEVAPVTEPTAETETVRVRKLTGDNINALKTFADELPMADIGRTYVEFHGTPATATTALQAVMDGILATLGSRSYEYRSLCAVRRKLQAMA